MSRSHIVAPPCPVCGARYTIRKLMQLPWRQGSWFRCYSCFNRWRNDHIMSAKAHYRQIRDEIYAEGGFTVTEAHLVLLQHANISWYNAETGAPTIDPKRPYGNGTVADDVAGFTDPEYDRLDEDARDTYCDDDAVYERQMRLHAETAFALQIALVTGRFQPGRYKLETAYDYRTWRLDLPGWEEMSDLDKDAAPERKQLTAIGGGLAHLDEIVRHLEPRLTEEQASQLHGVVDLLIDTVKGKL